jgi:type IVB pilus formation R64 PilN family outer membrane protein
MKKMGESLRAALRAMLGAAVIASVAGGCAQLKDANNAVKTASEKALEAQERAAIQQPIVQRTAGSWLLGDTVQVDPEMSPILKRQIGWAPPQKVTLAELAAYVTKQVGLPVDISEVQRVGGASTADVLSTSTAPTGAGQLPLPAGMMSAAGAAATKGGSSQATASLPPMQLSYQGDVKGLLDFAANEEGLWWKMDDGAVEFYRTITKTFYIPAINRHSSGTNSIVAQSGPGSLSSSVSSSGGSGGSANAQTTGSSNVQDSYDIDVWKTIANTAKTVAGESGGGAAAIAIEASLGSITVTGSPTQVKNVEQWARGLADKLSQQVMVTVSVYSVDISNEDNYSWSPTLLYQKLSSVYGLSLTPAAAPAITSALSPMVLSGTATGSNSSLNGSKLAISALSTLGHVSETMNQSVVTLNGQPAPMQIANEVTYLASSGSTVAANVGTTSTLTPGVVTTGFTAMFLPQIVNGRVLLSMDMTNSVLNSINTATSGGSSIQTPNVSSTTFQQSVSLTPGQALMLAGVQQDNSAVNHSGVGSPYNVLLGGGVDGTRDKKLIAIVITAHVL